MYGIMTGGNAQLKISGGTATSTGNIAVYVASSVSLEVNSSTLPGISTASLQENTPPTSLRAKRRQDLLGALGRFDYNAEHPFICGVNLFPLRRI